MSSFFIANFFHHFLIWIVVSNMNITTRPVFSIELYQIHNAKWNRGWHNRQGIHLMLDEWKIMVDYLISQLSQKERIRTTKSLRNKQIRCHIQATVRRGQWISHGPRPYSNTWADVAPNFPRPFPVCNFRFNLDHASIWLSCLNPVKSASFWTENGKNK